MCVGESEEEIGSVYVFVCKRMRATERKKKKIERIRIRGETVLDCATYLCVSINIRPSL